MAVSFVPRGTDRAHQVAALLGCPTSEVVLHRRPNRRPAVAAPRGAACSFAHRGGISMAGATWAGLVGVDLEVIRDDLDAVGIAETLFSPGEATWLKSLRPGQRSLAFTALWCIKEAVLKAAGQGIAGGMEQPAVAGEHLLPLLAGADLVVLRPAAGTSVELRPCRLATDGAVACAALAVLPDR